MSEFEQARADVAKARSEWNAKLEQLEALKVLAIWNGATDAERKSDRYVWARSKMERYWPPGKPQPPAWRIQSLAAAAQEQIDLGHPQWIAAMQASEAAQAAETTRLARRIQPRHRAAVKKLAVAVEALAEAMVEEKSCRDELAQTAPNPSSPLLPPCGIGIAPISDPNGHLFRWRKQIRALGMLD